MRNQRAAQQHDRLAAELEDSFPASDPPAITRRSRSGKQGVVLSGENARQGQIVLRTRAMRAIFIAGLIACVALALWLALHR